MLHGVIMAFFSMLLRAEEGKKHDLQKAYQEAVSLAQNLQNKGSAFSSGEAITGNGCAAQVDVVDMGSCLEKKQEPMKEADTAPEESYRLLVFVSFSMPEESLKQLLFHAEKYKATLILRGLHQDSFQKTAHLLQELGGGMEINPTLFEEHQISSVPVFVWVRQNTEVHRISGNITLPFAYPQLKGAL